MKKYSSLIVFALISLFALAACDDDEKPVSIDTEASVVLSKDTVYFSRAGGEVKISVTTNASPVTASAADGWVSTSISVGEPTELVLKVAKYEGSHDSSEENKKDKDFVSESDTTSLTGYDPRMTTVTVTCGEISKTIVVFQTPEDLLIPEEWTYKNYCMEGSTFSAYWNGLEIIVNFYTNGEPTIDFPWWIQQIEYTKKDGYEAIAKFKVLANYGKARTGKIVFSYGESSFTCLIPQSATNFDFKGVQKSATDLSHSMKCGWTFTGIESPDAVDALLSGVLDTLSEAGVNVVRIPCQLMADTTVSADFTLGYLKKVVDEVTSYKVGSDPMYAIVSMVNDGWMKKNLADTATVFSRFEKIWTLIANDFIESDYHVIFEAFDNIGETDARDQDIYYARLSQIFVDVVRRSGANNFKRCIAFPAYDAETDGVTTFPTDWEPDGRFFGSLPLFRPTDYTQPGATSLFWGEPYKSESGNWSAYTEEQMKAFFSNLSYRLATVPVIINACGSIAHKSLDGDLFADSESYYIGQIASMAKENYMVPVLYDDAICAESSFGVISLTDSNVRVQRRQYFNSFVDAIYTNATE